MKKVLQILGGILFLSVILLGGNVILADEEEIPVKSVILVTNDGQIRAPKDSNEVTITVEEGTNFSRVLITYDSEYTNGVVSGGAVTVKKDSQSVDIIEDINVRANGDNVIFATIKFYSTIAVTPGMYDIVLPFGYFVQDNIPTAETIIHLSVLPLPKDKELSEPTDLIWNEDNTVSWNEIDGADKYTLTFYVKDEAGNFIRVHKKYKDANNDSVTLTAEQWNSSLGRSWKKVYKNFPFEDGETYYFSVQARSSNSAYRDSEIVYSEGKVMHVTVDDNMIASDLVWKDSTALWRRAGEEEAFLKLYRESDDGTVSKVFTSRMTRDNFDIHKFMTEKGCYYFEILPVIYRNNQQILGKAGRSAITVIGDDAAQKNIVDNILNKEFTEENVTLHFNDLKKAGIDNVTEVLQNDKTLADKYKVMDQLYEKINGIEVQSPAVEDAVKNWIDSSSIQVAGLALNSEKNRKPQLDLSMPEKEVILPDSEKYSKSVQLNIKVNDISTITTPIVITMKKPKGIEIENLVILHYMDQEVSGGEERYEKLIPITKEGSDEITFVVSHFSTFVFANSAKNIISNGSSSRRSSTVTALKQGWDSVGTEWKYRKADGSYAKNEWQLIDGKWYYFEENFVMATGWKWINGKWYYLDDKNGDMKIDWQQINGKWYYMDRKNGDMKVGWIYWNKKWYYLNWNGDMATGWKQIGEKWYYLTKNGDCLINTITPDGYRVDQEGVWIKE